jgi:Cu-processing system permease protein
MMGRVLVIALNTYRESVRARILIGLAGVAFAVSIYSLIVGTFTLTDAPRVVGDLGAASVSIFGIAVAVVIGATSLHRELEQKTLFPILARPILRGEYLVGKYFGTLLTIAVFVLADAGLVLMLLAMLGGRSPTLVVAVAAALGLAVALGAWRVPWLRTFGPIPWSVAMAVAGILLSGISPEEQRVVLISCTLTLFEVAIVAAIATLFSSFSTPFLSAILTIGLWIVGRQADALQNLPEKFFGSSIAMAGKALSRVVPNLQVYVPPRPLMTGEAADVAISSYMTWAIVSSVAWAVGLLAVASFVFRKRDFL